MDVCAELTLRLARAAQEALNREVRSLIGSSCPHTVGEVGVTRPTSLAAARKPAVVGPLVEPGSIAPWSLDELSSSYRGRVEREFANRREYFGEKLEGLNLTDDDYVETPDGEFRVVVADFRRWASEYSIAVGIAVSKSPNPHTGRLHIRPPGGGGPPVGWVENVERPANGEL